MGDLQIPYQHAPSLNAIEAFCKDYRPDALILGGDFGEFEAVSDWDKGKRQIEGKRIQADFDACNKELDRIDKFAKFEEKIFIMGNHEDRVERFLDVNPVLEGALSVEKSLALKERGYRVIPFEQRDHKIGRLYITHGWRSQQYPARVYAHEAAGNIAVFHHHTALLHTTNNLGRSHACFVIPCLCQLNRDWLKGRPTHWVNGFGLLETMPSRNFNVYIVHISSTPQTAEFSWNGRVYRG